MGPETWIRLDNVTVRYTPAAANVGTECLEPGASADVLSSTAGDPPVSVVPSDTPLVTGAVGPAAQSYGVKRREEADPDEAWIADGFERDPEALVGGMPSHWIAVAAAGSTSTLTYPRDVEISPIGHGLFTFWYWLASTVSPGELQVSLDGTTWDTVHRVDPSDSWMPVDVDMSAFSGLRMFVRFRFYASEAADGASGDVWRLAVHR